MKRRKLALAADATLMGAVGLPEFEQRAAGEASGKRPPRHPQDARSLREPAASPLVQVAARFVTLKNHLVDGTNMIIVRELTGGMYYGTPRGISGSGADERAVNTMVYHQGGDSSA